MAKRRWVATISILTIAAGLKLTSPANAVDNELDCSALPDGAVATLPFPLNKWGQVICTPLGQMLTSHDGWTWLMPDGSGTVLVPSQDIADPKDAVGKMAYFTKIEVTPAKGEEFEKVYGTFHIGFDDKEPKPDAYRVDMTAVSGKTIRIFFFDYDTYAWGMACEEAQCDPETRFVILDKDHRPKPRQKSI
jgi:hypothetical protein